MQFLSSFYNHRTDEYGGSFENRCRFWLELLEVTREAVEGECAVVSRIAVDALAPVRDRHRGGARLHPGRRPPRRPLGRERRLGGGVVEGLGPVEVLPPGLPARMDRARAFGDREADRRRLAADRPRPHGRDRAQRRLGRDRGGPAVDRRPVPPDEDRRGTARRDPRVHRLQHLHPQVGPGRQHRLHAERHRGRGVPARLAPGALRAGREPRSRRARRGRGPRRNGVRDRARQARLPPRPPRRRRGRHRRDHALDPAAARAGRVGTRPQLAPDPARQAEERPGPHRPAARRRRRPRVRRRARRRRHGRVLVADGPPPRDARSRRGRGRLARARPHARADHGRGEGAARRAGGRLRRRRLLHGPRPRREARARRLLASTS